MSDRETVLRVEGMTCGNCVRHVDETLRELDGVEDVAVSLPDGRATVKHAAACSVEAMLEALREAGYDGAA